VTANASIVIDRDDIEIEVAVSGTIHPSGYEGKGNERRFVGADVTDIEAVNTKTGDTIELTERETQKAIDALIESVSE
jgi:hypothetical protein